jgi:hypothetical protein
VAAIAAALDLDADEFSAQFVTALAALAHTTGKDLDISWSDSKITTSIRHVMV